MTVNCVLQKFALFIYFVLISEVHLLEETCNTEKCSASSLDKPENKYSKDANSKYSVYFQNVEEALSKYEPCTQDNCSCHVSTLMNDLKPFKQTGISKEMFESIKKKGTKYQIVSGHLYRQKECLFPARCSGIEYFLLRLLGPSGASRLPDVELVINTRDWPQLNRAWKSPLAPILSFSKTEDYWDIMYPAWSFWEGGPAIKLYPSGLGKWQQHRASLTKAAEKFPWEKKKQMGFFRGSRTSDERDPIVLLSRARPDLVDAMYTKNQAWKSDGDTLYAPPAEEVSLEDHCQFRYLFNYRGVAASFRFKHLFLCKSLVFHIGDEWLEFFYPSFKPWVHYIPVSAKATQEDIKGLIEFFKEHDSLAKDIALRGFQHVWDHLRIADVKCYWKKLIKGYAKLMKYKVVRDEELIEIMPKN